MRPFPGAGVGLPQAGGGCGLSRSGADRGVSHPTINKEFYILGQTFFFFFIALTAFELTSSKCGNYRLLVYYYATFTGLILYLVQVLVLVLGLERVRIVGRRVFRENECLLLESCLG